MRQSQRQGSPALPARNDHLRVGLEHHECSSLGATSSPSPMKVIILAPTRSLSSYQHDHPSRNYNVIILVLKLKLEVEHTDGALHLTPRGATPPAAHSSLGKMLQNRDDCPPRLNTPAAHFILREGAPNCDDCPLRAGRSTLFPGIRVARHTHSATTSHSPGRGCVLTSWKGAPTQRLAACTCSTNDHPRERTTAAHLSLEGCT